MQEFKFIDGVHNGKPTPSLWLAKGIAVVKFEGSTISGFCAIAGEDYTKNGKWSNTTYRLVLAPGVRPLYFLAPLHGTWGQDLGSWGEVAEKLALPIDVAQGIIRAEYKRTAARLDELEAFALEQDGATVETVIISFGSPTNRQIDAGWWDESKSARTSDGREVVVAPGLDDEGWWNKPRVLEPTGATVIAVTHRPGMHGGYWSVEVAVPV